MADTDLYTPAFKSKVWAFFKLSRKEDSSKERKVYCSKCDEPLNYANGNTSVMKKHLKRKHDCDVDVMAGSSAGSGTSTIVDAFAKQRKLDLKDNRSQQIIKLVANVIVKDMRPLSIVEDQGFTELIQFLEPRFQMVSRKYLSTNVIPKMYASVQAKLMNVISEADAISLTTDGWTSRANENYLTITVHVLNNWEMSSYVLSTEEMPESHTARNLATRLTKALCDWKIASPVEDPRFVTTDNANNIVKGSSLAQSQLCAI